MSAKMQRIIIILGLTLIMAISAFSLAIGYAGGIRGIGLLGVWFFLTCGTVVVLAQLIPAGILIASFIASGVSFFKKRQAPLAAT